MIGKTQFNIVKIEATKAGWIIKEKGKHVELFFHWDKAIRHLEERLTSKWEETK